LDPTGEAETEIPGLLGVLAIGPDLDLSVNGILILETNAPLTGRQFMRGDVEEDGKLTIADAIGILDLLFGEGEIDCEKKADIDDNGAIDIGDAIRLLDYIFGSGKAPAPPFPDSGVDPTPDALPCR